MPKSPVRLKHSRLEALLAITLGLILVFAEALAVLGRKWIQVAWALDWVTGFFLRAVARRVLPVDLWLGGASQDQFLLIESFVFTVGLFAILVGGYLLYRCFRPVRKSSTNSNPTKSSNKPRQGKLLQRPSGGQPSATPRQKRP